MMYHQAEDLRIFRYEMPFAGSNMYLLLQGRHALVIDPVRSEEGLRALEESGAEDVLILLTHEHFDHTNGVNAVRQSIPSRLLCTKLCAESIAVARNNRSGAVMGLVTQHEREALTEFYRGIGNYVCTAEETFESELEKAWAGHTLRLRATPGHSRGSCCIELDNTHVFTGDVLIPNTPVITRFPGGSMEEYEAVTLPYLRSLDEKMQVMPGHGIPCPMKKFLQEDTRFTELS